VEKEQRFYPLLLLLLMMMMMMMVLEIRSSEYIDSLKATHTNIEKRGRERAISSALARDVESVLRVPDVIILNSMVLNFAFAEFRISAKEYRK